jgi:poly-gamma-glutamate synthesis protein (capsule biosynthesis protein)
MAITVALAGDTMLGRGVGEVIAEAGPRGLFDPAVLQAAHAADLFVLNLECCLSERGTPWPAPGKPFFFRAPPAAVETLLELGVDCVSLANNHALDYGVEALLDTCAYLERAGIAWAGAGPDLPRARTPALLEHGGTRVAVVAFTDHPADFAAAPDRAGVAYAELRGGTVPAWLPATLADARSRADVVLATPHWGPNMTLSPPGYVRATAPQLLHAGATVVAGHSAHCFHGVQLPVLWDLGDFIDDYAVDPELRNDLGLLWFVTLDASGPVRLEALPLRLRYARTEVAQGADAWWIRERLRVACAEFGTAVSEEDGRLVIRAR